LFSIQPQVSYAHNFTTLASLIPPFPNTGYDFGFVFSNNGSKVQHLNGRSASYRFVDSTADWQINCITGNQWGNGISEAAAAWGSHDGSQNLVLNKTTSSNATLAIGYDPAIASSTYALTCDNYQDSAGHVTGAWIHFGPAMSTTTHADNVWIMTHELGHFAWGLKDLNASFSPSSAVMYYGYDKTHQLGNAMSPTVNDQNGVYIAQNLNWYQSPTGQWKNWNNNGGFASGWKQISGLWYHFNSSGILEYGWVWDGSNWYHTDSYGAMQENQWISDNGWYYLKSGGSMACNESLYLNGKTYYFNSSGLCTNP
jgi:hypothetical protein